MSSQHTEHDTPPPHSVLFASPLDFLIADHNKQKLFFEKLDRLADAEHADSEAAAVIVDFLNHDLALHILDEEQDLFPLLRRRCPPEDEIEHVLSILDRDHEKETVAVQSLVHDIEACMVGGTPPRSKPALRSAIHRFARQQLRHIGVENSIIIPIAKARLIEDDLENLSKRMIARRGGR